MRMITKLGLTAAFAVGGGALLIGSTLSHAQHYRLVDELIDDGLASWGDTEVKVHGFVAPGTIASGIVDQQMTHSFVLEMHGAHIRVFHRGPVPDTFKDNAELVATGHVVAAPTEAALAAALHIPTDSAESWVVAATDLMAKCPDHYAEQAGARSTAAQVKYRGSDN